MNIPPHASIRNTIVLIVILLAFINESKAQNISRIDSLINLISSTTNPIDKIDLYNQPLGQDQEPMGRDPRSQKER